MVLLDIPLVGILLILPDDQNGQFGEQDPRSSHRGVTSCQTRVINRIKAVSQLFHQLDKMWKLPHAAGVRKSHQVVVKSIHWRLPFIDD